VQTSKTAEQGKPITILIRSTFLFVSLHTHHTEWLSAVWQVIS